MPGPAPSTLRARAPARLSLEWSRRPRYEPGRTATRACKAVQCRGLPRGTHVRREPTVSPRCEHLQAEDQDGDQRQVPRPRTQCADGMTLGNPRSDCCRLLLQLVKVPSLEQNRNEPVRRLPVSIVVETGRSVVFEVPATLTDISSE